MFQLYTNCIAFLWRYSGNVTLVFDIPTEWRSMFIAMYCLGYQILFENKLHSPVRTSGDLLILTNDYCVHYLILNTPKQNIYLVQVA